MRDWLVEIRKQHKLSQYGVADLCGISQSYYAAIETETRKCSVGVAKKIASVLGFDWTRFFDDTK